MGKIIGIDLGTTNSVVAVMENGQPVIIANAEGKRTTPSVIGFAKNGDVLVGDAARRQAVTNPRNTVYSAKRFMGRGADDAETRRLGTYAFAPPGEGEANVVRFRVAGRAVTPVEVSAEILRALKAQAEDAMRAVGGAVITVPA